MSTDCEFSFNLGNKLVLQLNDDIIYEGTYVSGDSNHIQLINISTSENPTIVKGPYVYYRKEIVSVQMLRHDFEYLSYREIAKLKVENPNLILMDELEYARLRDLSNKCTYITSYDKKYFDAMEKMKEHEAIGLSAIMLSLDKHALISLICFSTWDHVYVLDFWLLNTSKFPIELQSVLECKRIMKVMHDSRSLCEILRLRFDIEIQNLFDTKFADMEITKKQSGKPNVERTLQECLTHYLNFPTKFLRPEVSPLSLWKKRPLSTKKKFQAAQEVTYLISLMELTKVKLFPEIYEAMENYGDDVDDTCVAEVPQVSAEKSLCDSVTGLSLK